MKNVNKIIKDVVSGLPLWRSGCGFRILLMHVRELR